MPFYQRFTKLPDKGTAVESAILDLKETMSAKKENFFTLANDVAAFANHLGGVLLVGAEEDKPRGVVKAYAGLDEPLVNDLQTAFTDAVKDRCSPRPPYDFGRFDADDPGKKVLAVFVEPYVGGQLVGVGVKGIENNDKYKGDSYVFPVRSGKATKHLMPEQLLMFTEPRIRRVFIQLSAIGVNERVLVTSKFPDGTRSIEEGTFREVSATENTLRLDLENSFQAGPGRLRLEGSHVSTYAIDQVKHVHRDGDSWFIAVD